MRYKLLISYLILISLLFSIVISQEELPNNTTTNAVTLITPRACVNSNYPNSNEIENQINAQVKWGNIGTIINNGLGLIPGVGQISSTLFSVLWAVNSPSIVEQMVRYINDAIRINLICQNYADSLTKFEILNDRIRRLHQCIKEGVPCYQGSKELEFMNVIGLMTDLRNSFGGPQFIVLFEESKLTLLPLYAQYVNLYLSFLRDQLVDTSNLQWDTTHIEYFKGELTSVSIEATDYAYSVYNDGLKKLPQSTVTSYQDYNKIAKYITTYTTGVLVFADKWKYLNIIKYPFGPLPTTPRSIYTPIVGVSQSKTFSNPLNRALTNSYPPKAIHAHRMNYWKSCKESGERFKGIGKINFINDNEPGNIIYGSEIDLELAGSAYSYPLDSFLTSITVYHGSYIDALDIGSSIGFTPYGTTGKIDGSFSTNVQKTNFTYPGFYISGIAHIDMESFHYCTTHVIGEMSFIFNYYGDLIPTRKSIPGLQLHRYIQRLNFGVKYRLLNYYEGESYEGWSYDGPVWNALSFGYTDSSTAIVYQYYKVIFGRNYSFTKYYYYSTNPRLGNGWKFDYPVFNVYINPSTPDVIPVYEYRQAINTDPVTPAVVPSPGFNSIFSTDESLSGWSRIGIAWYTKKPVKNIPTVNIDNAFKYFYNGGISSQCLTVNHQDRKIIPKQCAEDVNQVWQIETYPSGIQMVNPVGNGALSKDLGSNGAKLSPPTVSPDALGSFEFYSPRDNHFMIKMKNTNLCLQVLYSNNYYIEFQPCDLNNWFQKWIPNNLHNKIIDGSLIPVNLMGCVDSLGYLCPNTLSEGQSLRSQMGSKLYLNPEGYLEIIKSDSSIIWRSNVKPASPDRPYKAIMQTDGNFVLYGASGKAYYATGVNSKGSIVNFVNAANFNHLAVQDRLNNVIWSLK